MRLIHFIQLSNLQQIGQKKKLILQMLKLPLTMVYCQPICLLNLMTHINFQILLLAILISDILINELQVTSYELISLRVAFIARVMSYDLVLFHELRVTFCIRVTRCCLLHELRVTFYIRFASYCYYYCTSYEPLFIARVTSCCLLHGSRVIF